MTPDIVNALFEVFGTVVTLLSVRRLYIDKQVKGVSVWPWIFFTSWGIWNLYYYAHLEQWFSCFASLPIANSLWLYFYWKYRNGKD